MNSKLFIGFCLFLAACGGKAVIDGEYGAAGSPATTTETTTASSTSTSTVTTTETETTTATTTDTGTAGEGGAGGSVATGGEGGTACTPEVTVTSLSNNAAIVAPGDTHVATLTFEIAVSDCTDVELATIGILLWTPDADPIASFPFCAGTCQSVSDWNFHNLKVVDVQTDATIEGPGELHAGAQGQPARLDLNDARTLYAGQALTLQVVMDIADPLKTQISGTRFQAFLLGIGVTQQNAILTFVHQEDPDDFITVQDDGNVSMKLDINLSPTTPQSQIVVAGKDVWVPYSEYRVTNGTDEDQEVVAAQIQQKDPNGDAEDFVEVALAMDGTVRLAGSEHYTTDFEYFSIHDVWNPLVIPAQETVMVQVWAKTANVMSSLETGGEWHGFPRSGHSDSLRLQQLQLASDPPNVAQVSAELKDPQRMVLRKSKPFIAKQSLSTTTLANIDQDLVKFQVAADSAGSIAIRQLRFSIQKSPGVSLSWYKLRRGASDLPVTDVWFNIDVPDPDTMIVMFAHDEVVSGSGNVYTIHATVSGAVNGSWIATSLVRSDPALAPVTGFIASCYPAGMWESISPVHTDEMQYGCESLGVLWSDLSELPHDSMGNESGDWTNDNLVQNMDLVQVLSS